ncbi:MAG: coat protein [Cressdnaviricota sp.]|nr:MAG: coat protein [Cressdnaviricota sp.]
MPPKRGYFSSAAMRSMARKGGVGKPKAKAPYRTMRAAAPRSKKGRTGTKRRAAPLRSSAAVTSAPVTMGISVTGGLQSSFTQKQMSGGGLRITGRSFITSVDTAGKYSNGLLAVADCNPVLLNDRVATIATTYEKYVYQSITYRYVPQCATSTAGSVMLTFERDPANPAANGGDTSNFMQNCMSYEHTSITPPWVGSSVTYKRDANEKKLFYISGQGSNYNPRDTSQGSFLCYGANVPTVAAGAAGGGLGFIVMDYVLDLCEPSIMPARTGAGIAGASATNIPSQWQFATTNAITKVDAVGASSLTNAFTDLSNGLFGAANQNCIIELLLEGTAVPSTGNTNWATSEQQAKLASPVATTLGRGSHLYMAVRRAGPVTAQGPDQVSSTTATVILTRNLADAVAALSATGDLLTTTGTYSYGNGLYPIKTLASVPLSVAGFYRQITLKATDDYQV